MPEVLWLLIAVVLVMGLAYLFTRYVAGNQMLLSQHRKNTKMLHIVEQTYMGRDRQIVLLQAGDRYFLLGNTPEQITTLAEFSAGEVDSWREKEKQTGEEGQTPSFT
ncbi:MAG: flagellar biosynthetic protein FliO, partial [Oscillospiraceae bacterium]|nr:flagellar biosynthetic protein FliO [Oscillospiraceae bacterium]